MYIEDITIDGFKSYAQRVNLPNFDPCFNAITGLNGSGKSNILDSICFVLGISNLQQVRASNMQDLVYKQGQAGISKATVSITFRNDVPAQGPAGYEDKERITVTRQIVVGGRQKYMINGHVAQPSRVQDLFHSVQLNVNNPHFLIMQGRITKVLNMKPPEILSLLEEASGTRMYEKKKEASLKTLEKKDKKLAEIDEVLETQLNPALEKLKRDCSTFYTYAEECTRAERLKKFCLAYDYVTAVRKQGEGQQVIQQLQQHITSQEEKLITLQEDLREKEAAVLALQAEKEIQSGGEVVELQKEVDTLAMQLTKDKTSSKNMKKTLAKEKSELQQLDAGIKELDDSVLEAVLQKVMAERDSAQQALEAAEKEVEAANRELAGAEAGDGRDESNRSLAERLADAKNDQTAADAEAKAAQISEKHLRKQLSEQQRQLASKEKEDRNLQAGLEKHKQEVQDCQARLEGLGFDQAREQQLLEVVEQEKAAVREFKQKVDSLSAVAAAFDFHYNDPYPGFDRRKVHGTIGRLLRVKDLETAGALQIVAGGRLQQVVVDDQVVGKDILERSGQRSRITVVPLNKCKQFEVSASQIRNARQLVGDKFTPAVDLVEYDPRHAPAMKFAFGGNFVCEDAATANKLAFSRDVAVRSVTLEGDDFNPAGTLTGGSKQQSSRKLALLQELMEAEEHLHHHQMKLQEAEQQLAAMAADARAYKQLKQQLELKQHSLSLMEERVAVSESAQLAAAVAETEAQLEKAAADLAAAVEKKEKMVALAKQLAEEIKNFDRDRGARIKAAKDRLSAAKKGVEAARKQHKAAEQALQTAVAEKETAETERKALEEQRGGMETSITDLEAKIAELDAAVEEAQSRHKAAEARLKSKKARLRECDEEIKAAAADKERLAATIEKVEQDKRKAAQEQAAAGKAIDDYRQHVQDLEAEHSWILQEKEHFGVGDYDFQANNPTEKFAELKEAQRAVDELKKKGINKNAQLMYEQNEADCKVLQEKRQVVENDRQKITTVIQELDDKKKDALKVTWTRVNEDFGKIFSTLLPGTMAKLEPSEGKSFLDGLEVKVAFGSVWKESLTELSGGQRSLLALSLILALCRFKPAPLYILDEVDAALDLNHTQNIGRMIKEHFPESQFIVVSLKEGMFSNANVIFRTKFVDGVSTVMRTENTPRNENAGAGTSKGNRAAAPDASRNRQVLRETNRG